MTIGDYIYPCDAGTGRPMGYHNFTATPGGVVCSLCGQVPGQIKTIWNSSHT
jgi:hypothetical protein